MEAAQLKVGGHYVVLGYGEPVELHSMWPRRVLDPSSLTGSRLLGYDVIGSTRAGLSVSAKAESVVAEASPRACQFCKTMVDPDLAECPRCHAAVALDEAVVEALAEAGRSSLGGTWLSEMARAFG